MPAFTPQEMHPLFERAFNQGDIEAMLALDESGAILVVNGKPLAGIDEIREALRLFIASGRDMKLETRMLVEGADGLALLHGAWSIGSEQRGISTEVVRRHRDGSWLFILDNPNTPL